MFDMIEQKELKCISILTKVKVGDYLSFVESIYNENGGIAGQRAPLKTKTALTIRSRMVSDIVKGAVLPPVVVGVHINSSEIGRFSDLKSHDDLMAAIGEPNLGRVSIIDGMQRTTAIIDAVEVRNDVSNEYLRVEYWVSSSLNNLIYRMLVLNTGQVPWDVSRQLKTIYSPLIQKIVDGLGDEIAVFNKDFELRRRTRAGQYQSENLIQLLLNFSSGKYEIDLKDKITEDFARLDLIESSSHEMFLEYFVSTIKLMTELDICFSKYVPNEDLGYQRYNSGGAIFKSFPAQVGFCVAMSNYVFDEPGFQIDWADAETKFEAAKARVTELSIKLDAMTNDELGAFLELQVLDELMDTRKSQVGRVERRFFTEAFRVLISKTERLQDMNPCWRKA